MGEFLERLNAIFNEMAFSRNSWIERVRDKHLSGALGEYAKLYISRELKETDHWSFEVKTILSKVSELMNREKHITTFKNREKALKEAIYEASSDYSQITSAKNQCINKYGYDAKKVMAIKISSEELMKKMIAEFLPEYLHLVD